MTTFNALPHSGAGAGDLVAVHGDAVGTSASSLRRVRVLHRRGQSRPHKEELARKLGASDYIDSSAEDPAKALPRWRRQGDSATDQRRGESDRRRPARRRPTTRGGDHSTNFVGPQPVVGDCGFGARCWSKRQSCRRRTRRCGKAQEARMTTKQPASAETSEAGRGSAHSRNASASSHGCSTFSVSSSSARVRPRLTAAIGLPALAAHCTKRRPE